MKMPDLLVDRIVNADHKFGAFSSTHEVLGVALEEWQELIAAVHANDLEQVRMECLDLAAVLLRAYEQLRSKQLLR